VQRLVAPFAGMLGPQTWLVTATVLPPVAAKAVLPPVDRVRPVNRNGGLLPDAEACTTLEPDAIY
jgi:hypothetical protein